MRFELKVVAPSCRERLFILIRGYITVEEVQIDRAREEEGIEL